MKTALDEIHEILAGLYEPRDINLWLETRQKLLGNVRPIDLINAGLETEVLRVLRAIQDGAYL